MATNESPLRQIFLFLQKYRNWVAASGIIFLILLYIMGRFIFVEGTVLPANLRRYMDIPLFVGESASRLDPYRSTIIAESDIEGYHRYQLRSRKLDTLVTDVYTRGGRIIEVDHPITLAENVTFDQLNLTDKITLLLGTHENEATTIAVFGETGFALQYHDTTRTLYRMYQFVAGQEEAFLSRHPEFEEKSTEEEEPHQEEYPDFFATTEEAEQIEATRSGQFQP